MYSVKIWALARITSPHLYRTSIELERITCNVVDELIRLLELFVRGLAFMAQFRLGLNEIPLGG